MRKIYTSDELIVVNGKNIEKESAFPDLKGDQKAVMLQYKEGRWILSIWNSFIDGNETVACGWEQWNDGTFPEMLERLMSIAASIEKGE